ncbi:hypothetical protein B0H10DRAFT_894447 [Mycena sp. CBHHK59/15]|nr:hypothetical protein B0H10DRAFT_894447 [Mycena sp. CBHHK59/15]
MRPPPSIYVVSAFICNLGRAVLTNHTVDDTDPSVIYDTPGEGGPYPCNPTICNAPGTPDENNYGQMIQGTMTVVPDGVLTTIRFTGIPLLYDCPMRLNSLFTCSLSQAIQFVFSLRLEMIRPVRFSSTVKASVGSSIPRPLPPLTVCWATEIHPCQMGPTHLRLRPATTSWISTASSTQLMTTKHPPSPALQVLRHHQPPPSKHRRAPEA